MPEERGAEGSGEERQPDRQSEPGFAEAHYNRGVTLVALRRCAEAVASYDRALALRPDFAQAHADRGAALAALGRYDAALAGYDRALALDPGATQARYNRGVALAVEQHDKGTREIIEDILKDEKNKLN